MAKVKDVVTKLVAPIIDSLEADLELVDVEYVKEGKDMYLRVYIYKKDGVSIDDCVLVTRAIEGKLDEADPIKDPYILEVSSPGLDRPFKTDDDYRRYADEEVEVNLFQAIDGTKYFEGILIGKENDLVKISINDEIISFDVKNISTVKRIIKF